MFHAHLQTNNYIYYSSVFVQRRAASLAKINTNQTGSYRPSIYSGSNIMMREFRVSFRTSLNSMQFQFEICPIQRGFLIKNRNRFLLDCKRTIEALWEVQNTRICLEKRLHAICTWHSLCLARLSPQLCKISGKSEKLFLYSTRWFQISGRRGILVYQNLFNDACHEHSWWIKRLKFIQIKESNLKKIKQI